MGLLPREQVVQRHPRACVSAPGVNLWASQTNLALCLVTNTDEVTEGEVEQAHAPSPYFEWYVEATPEFVGTRGFGEDPFGVVPFGVDQSEIIDDAPGVYQNSTFGEGSFGVGPFGGVEGWNYSEHPSPIYWADGDGEDGVYP